MRTSQSQRSARILQQLGLSRGAASHRLRQNILFSMVQRLHEDNCFVCKKKIKNSEELSIEHKEPWEGRSAELFWSLENIAFSHRKCNKQHTYGKGRKRNIGPEGTAWCNICKKFEAVENFHKHKNRWNGLAQHCKKYRRDRENRKPPLKLMTIAQECSGHL